MDTTRLSRFIVNQLPDALQVDGRALKREAEGGAWLDDPDQVLQRCIDVVEQAWTPSRRDAQPALHLGAFSGSDARNGAFSSCGGNHQISAAAGIADIVNAVVQKQLARARKDPKRSSERDKKQPSSRLPDGKRCSAGTCTFRHDTTHPGQPCWRNPRWHGSLNWSGCATWPRPAIQTCQRDPLRCS